jgi:ferritin-like metal-binding protein YciE
MVPSGKAQQHTGRDSLGIVAERAGLTFANGPAYSVLRFEPEHRFPVTSGTGRSNMVASRMETARSLFITGLKNAHALEQQASQIIGRQLDRIESYPDVADRLRQHLEETRTQQQRVEEILGSMNETYSALKDFGAGFMGNMAAIAHAPAPDEILKNSFANLAFENYEIAAYTSLIALAEANGATQALGLLERTLREEQDMAKWVADHLKSVTLTFLERSSAGAKADR